MLCLDELTALQVPISAHSGYAVDETSFFQGRSQHLKAVMRILARNVAGWVLVVVGFGLSLPGVPGPGTPIMLAGLAMADWPGKLRFFRWLQSYRWFSKIDGWLQRRFGIHLPGSHAPSNKSISSPVNADRAANQPIVGRSVNLSESDR